MSHEDVLNARFNFMRSQNCEHPIPPIELRLHPATWAEILESTKRVDFSHDHPKLYDMAIIEDRGVPIGELQLR